MVIKDQGVGFTLYTNRTTSIDLYLVNLYIQNTINNDDDSLYTVLCAAACYTTSAFADLLQLYILLSKL